MFISLNQASLPPSPYQVGGSLRFEANSYVERQADTALYSALAAGEFCYVLNCRQMGKSSLLVHTLHRLQASGHRCTMVDITGIGSDQVTQAQWYRGLVVDLWQGFALAGRVNYKAWWDDQGDIAPVQKLQRFLREVLLVEYPDQPLVILIDEIDSILSLGFCLDDFFALIRFCYNQRAIDPEYRRLTFAVFGVATPADLISDRQRTPFNIGQAITLQGFQWSECQPLLAGLTDIVPQAEAVLRAILAWTNGQPFLTQKLCTLVWQAAIQTTGRLIVPPDSEADWVEQLVRDRVIYQWEFQDEPEHLRTIRDRLLRPANNTGRILGFYQEILNHGEIAAEPSREQTELLLSGLVVKSQNRLQVKNPIYRQVFNGQWVRRHLQNLRPYSQTIEAWIASDRQDASRLLRGQALKDAQTWAQDKRLSDGDYQFLAASVENDRRESQQQLEAERAQAIASQLEQTQRSGRLQRWLLAVTSAAFLCSTGLGAIAFHESQRANQSEQLARRSEIQALIASAQGWFDSRNRLEALLQAVRAQRRLEQLKTPDPDLSQEVDVVLRNTIFDINQVNSFAGHQREIKQVVYNPDGSQIASVSADGVINLWRPDGTLMASLAGDPRGVGAIAFSPEGDVLATGDRSGQVSLWQSKTGKLLQKFAAHDAAVISLAFSPDGQRIASGSTDSTIRLWRQDGTPIRVLARHRAMIRALAFSPDGQLLASASADNTIRLWNPESGQSAATLSGHTATVTDVVFSPDGQRLASSSSDNTVRLWTRQGQLVKTLTGHKVATTSVRFSPDGETLVSTSLDHDVRFWNRNGEPILAYTDIYATGQSLDFSPDGQYLVSSGTGDDRKVALWRLNSPLYSVLSGHRAAVLSLATSPDGTLASASADGMIQLWDAQGSLLATLEGHRAPVLRVSFSPDGQTLASSSMDGTVRLWGLDGSELLVYQGHSSTAGGLAFSPDRPLVASGGDLMRLWQFDGIDVATLPVDLGNLTSLAWSPQGDRLAAGGTRNLIQLWDSEELDPLQTLEGHTAPVRKLAFSPDGKLLASASEDQTVKLWPLEGGAEPLTLGHTDAVRSVAFGSGFSAGQPIVASAGADKTIKLWTLDGQLLTTLNRHTSLVQSVVFSPDGQFLYSASTDKTIIRWDLNAVLGLDPLTYACDWLADYLRTNADLSSEDRHLCADR